MTVSFHLTVNLISQLPRTPKGHDPSRFQHHIHVGGWIPAFPLLLFFYTELAEAANQDILSGFKISFDDLEQSFNYVGRAVFCIDPGVGPSEVVDIEQIIADFGH